MAVPGVFKFVLLVGALFIELAAATTYFVGGPNGGWDMATDQQTWASNQSFQVGDNLIFQYSASHDVTEVTKADYDSCQGSNTIQAYTGGITVIPLTSPGNRYFICSIPGHCSAGMKLSVNVLAISATAESPAESPVASGLVGFGFGPAPSPIPGESIPSPSELPVPEAFFPSPSESPLSGASGLVRQVQGSEDPSNLTPLTRTTSTDLPTSLASKGGFKVGFEKGLIFVIAMLMAIGA